MFKNTKLWAFLLGYRESRSRPKSRLSSYNLDDLVHRGLINAYDSGRNFGDTIHALLNPEQLKRYVIVYSATKLRAIEALDYCHAETIAYQSRKTWGDPVWIVETRDVMEALKDYVLHGPRGA